MAVKKHHSYQPSKGTPVRTNFTMSDMQDPQQSSPTSTSTTAVVSRMNTFDGVDGTESLTYSVNSSSVYSATAESTDSSNFGEFLKKVINDDDSHLTLTEKELAFMKVVGESNNLATEAAYQSDMHKKYGAGQHTDSRLYDGGGFGGENSIMFAPAEHSSRRKKSKRGNSSQQTGGIKTSSSPTPSSRSTPVRKTRRTSSNENEKDNEAWYNQWWMCGLAQSITGIST